MALQYSQNERWSPVLGYEGLFEVSDLGRVRSLDRIVGHRWGGNATKKGQMLQTFIGDDGYWLVGLTRHGVTAVCRVHRLMAQAFLPPPLPEQVEVNHVDGDRASLDLANMEWATPKANIENAVARGALSGRTNPNRAKKLTAAAADAIKAYAKIGRSILEIAQEFDVSKSTVRRVVRGEVWK